MTTSVKVAPILSILFMALLVLFGPGARSSVAAPADSAAGGALFVENVGQWPEEVRFRLSGAGQAWSISDGALWLTLLDAPSDGEQRGTQLRLSFDAATPAGWEGIERSTAAYSFYGGRSSDARFERVPAWAALRWPEYRPGVDLWLGSEGSLLKAELVATRPGAEVPTSIPLRLSGARLHEGGELLTLESAGLQHQLRMPVGVSWQVSQEGRSVTVRSRETQRVRVEQGALNLLYSSFLGSEATDELYEVKGVGNNVYSVGYTAASIFPTRPGRFVTQHVIDVLVARVNIEDPNDRFIVILLATGGGDLEEFGNAIALDEAGNVYVVGETNSEFFPTTAGAFDTTFNGVFDAYLTKLSPAGEIIYSSFIGGAELDRARAIVVASNGAATIAGGTLSPNFPTTTTGVSTSSAGGRDAWIARLSPNGAALEYGTYIGGGAQDEITAMEVRAGRLYVVGWTSSNDWPTTANAFDNSFNGIFDSFMAQLDPGAPSLAYSSYLGGGEDDRATDLVLDASNRVTVVGYTRSPNFPVTSNSFDPSFGGGDCIIAPCSDGFLSRFTESGSQLSLSSFYGGMDEDSLAAIDLDSWGNYHLTGSTQSSDMPVTPDAYDGSYAGSMDALIAKVSADGGSLLYSTYLGSTNEDEGFDIDWAAPDRIYLAGQTESLDFPTAGNAYNPTHNGDADGFFMLWQDGAAPAAQLHLPLVIR